MELNFCNAIVTPKLEGVCVRPVKLARISGIVWEQEDCVVGRLKSSYKTKCRSCVMFRSSLYLKLSKQTLPNVLDDEVLIRNDGELIYSNGSVMFCIPAILNFPAPAQTIPEILARPYS